MKESRILLIGDEPNILRTLRRDLTGRGYDVAIALDDEQAYSMTSQVADDLYVLILDFTTVNIDGLRICERLRQNSQAPIIVLSAVGSESRKIKAFDLGADDYLVMPFNMEEFLARVRSALRRWAFIHADPQIQNRILLAGDLVIDVSSRQVTARGEIVKLTPTEYEILVYLAQRAGKVVSHREILRAIWGLEYGDEREYLRVFISQLRRKIEEDPMRPVHLLTEPGVGYRFAMEYH
jgi:two-component system, OmpR family, KDP operon response regulator KdpE